MAYSDYSGVVLNQNVASEDIDDVLSTGTLSYQTFHLPGDYSRGRIIPSLTGFQLFANITSGQAANASLSWTLDFYTDGVGWQTLKTGLTKGTPLDGSEKWFTVLFDKPVEIQSAALSNQYRIGFTGVANIPEVWYSVPNPRSTTGDKTYAADGTTPRQDSGRDISVMFRVLADVADSGRDFLGNTYRSAVTRNRITNVATGPSGDRDTFYLSAPQPSRFAVVSNYFDMRDLNGNAVVIDGVLIAPTTPGVSLNIYYSNDNQPGTDPASWDNLLWTHVPKTYQMVARANFAFPAPITAKYIKVEYSHLQARYYAPGNFQKPITYKKYPKWVTDYFLARVLSRNTEDPLIARRVEVVYDALDFAYNYYRDDLISGPDRPSLGGDIIPVLKAEDESLNIDFVTLAKIKIAFAPYLEQPGLTGRDDYILASYLQTVVPIDYPVEEIDRTRAAVNQVSSLNREASLLEKEFPQMFFYVPCRHTYRVAQARFDQDRAYFVGVSEIAFTRERFDSRSDASVYIESTGDLVNVERNDFETVDFSWVTYNVS